VGAHKGEILELFIKKAPNVRHYAFEPIPELYNNLKKKFSDRCNVFPFALSDKEGESGFQYVKNAPAYSGILKRRYAIQHPDIEELKVELKRLDSVIPDDVKVGFIKIDVEGAEMKILKNSKKVIANNSSLKMAVCTYHRRRDAKVIKNTLLKYNFNCAFTDGYMLFTSKRIVPPYFRHGLIRAQKKEL